MLFNTYFTFAAQILRRGKIPVKTKAKPQTYTRQVAALLLCCSFYGFVLFDPAFALIKSDSDAEDFSRFADAYCITADFGG